MKSILNNSLAYIAIIMLPFSSYALTEDTQQPINITSDSQSLDLESNTVTFSNNVVITQGTILIKAAQVTIVRPDSAKTDNANVQEKITATGAPVDFQQQLDNGKMVYGHANRVDYDVGTQFVVLTGNAQLKQQDSQIDAERITYDVQKQTMAATKSGQGRVKTVLYPAQLQAQ